MWKPNDKGIEELILLFSNSKGNDNSKHKEVYQKINEYSKNADFGKYLVYILNEETFELDVRQISGLTLKSVMEKDFSSISEDSLGYLRENILRHYLHDNTRIRKTISIIINTYIKQNGLENWPDLLDFLYKNLEIDRGAEISLEIINLIVEDSGSLLEEKFEKFIIKYIPKLINSLNTMKSISFHNEKIFSLILQSLELLFDNCPNIMNNYLEAIAKELMTLNDLNEVNIRYRMGRVWMSMIKFNHDVLVVLFNNLFNFFLENLKYEQYEINFNTCDFFNLILQDNGALLKNEQINSIFYNNLSIVIPRILVFMRLTQNDLCGIDSSYKPNNRSKARNEEEDEEEEEKMNEGSDYYNPNFTLRKCASKIIDSLSNHFPKEVYDNIKQHLDSGIQNQDWLVKERTILALGAVAIGSYEFLKPHLNNLVIFLINELRNANKLIRAITCWTLSRFTKFILLDNNVETSNDLFKSYLSETLTRFIDNDPIVQEAACTSFSTMISVKKEVLEPYLQDILKVICSVFNKYQGSSMLTLYDIISYMTEEYIDHFKNPQLIEDLLKSILEKFYTLNENDYRNVSPIFDILCSIIKASGELLKGFCKEFLTRALTIIDSSINSYTKNNKDLSYLDNELISKCIELISILCDTLPSFSSEVLNQSSILEYMNVLLDTHDMFLRHYVIALFGDLAKTKNKKLEENFDNIVNLLIQDLNIPNKSINDPYAEDKIHICNNSCWTLGLLSISYPEKIEVFIDQIMIRLLKIFCVPRLNKSIAQNTAICIGRMSFSNPNLIAKHLDSFVKQFCLSIRFADDSREKQEAFMGLCRSIIANPQGLINHLPYFCDAISQYENPPEELDKMFRDLINSYKTSLNNRWNDIFHNFPEKLQKKLIYRFNIA